MGLRIIILTSVALCLIGSASLRAQEDSPKRSVSSKDRAAKKPNSRTAPRRPATPAEVAKVNSFVADCLPELKRLLDVLKESQPKKYSTAIRELFNAADRLERIKQRDNASYALALKSWQLDKRAQLLAARIRMGGSSTDEAKLRSLLGQRFELELQIMLKNRDRQAARLKKLDGDIARFRTNRDQAVDAQVKAWMRLPSGKSKTVAENRKKKNRATKTSAGSNEQIK